MGRVKVGLVIAFITKYNPDGTKAWTRLLGTIPADSVTALTTGTDGAIYVAGVRWELGWAQYNGNSDAFITSYNPDGTRSLDKIAWDEF
jgi:hypothetical protein